MCIDLSFVNQFVFENLELPRVSSSGLEFTARCPICGDSKKNKQKRRFNLKFENEENIFYHCFNCEATGNFIDLYAFVKGISQKEAWKELRKFKPEQIKRKLKKQDIEKKEEKKEETYNFNYILKDCIGINSQKLNLKQQKLQISLKKFKEKRKLDIPIFVSYRGEYQNRIIIPIIENKKIIYFQGRAINDTILPKYKNPAVEKESIILNRLNFDKQKYIIITEGVLDALSVGNQATSCLGASIKDDFLKKLFKMTDTGIIVALDNDETGRKNIHKIIKESKYTKKLKFFLFPYKYNHIKDLNQLLTDSKEKDLYSFVVNNSYDYIGTLIKLKLFCGGKN